MTRKSGRQGQKIHEEISALIVSVCFEQRWREEAKCYASSKPLGPRRATTWTSRQPTASTPPSCSPKSATTEGYWISLSACLAAPRSSKPTSAWACFSRILWCLSSPPRYKDGRETSTSERASCLVGGRTSSGWCPAATPASWTRRVEGWQPVTSSRRAATWRKLRTPQWGGPSSWMREDALRSSCRVYQPRRPCSKGNLPLKG